MDDKCQIGKLVYSKAGRDKDKCFIIIDILDDQYVYITDGNMRKIENPKKKKIKHLVFTDIVFDILVNKTMAQGNISNSLIKKFIQSHQV